MRLKGAVSRLLSLQPCKDVAATRHHGAENKASSDIKPGSIFILDLLAFRIMRNKFLLFTGWQYGSSGTMPATHVGVLSSNPSTIKKKTYYL
jgi:hypothetical protein